MTSAADTASEPMAAGLWAMAARRRLPGVAPVTAPAEGPAEPSEAPAAPLEHQVPSQAETPRQATRRAPATGTPRDQWELAAAVLEDALREGAEQRPCPHGGLSLVRPDGREVWHSARAKAEMTVRGLLSWELRDAASADALPADSPPHPYRPDQPDALRDGLLKGHRDHTRPAGNGRQTEHNGGFSDGH